MRLNTLARKMALVVLRDRILDLVPDVPESDHEARQVSERRLRAARQLAQMVEQVMPPR